jgi:NAD(P) transhydrogenase subunit alpha
MRLGVLRETEPGEQRVALVPETVKKLKAKKLDTIVERGAGALAGFTDAEYEAAGAELGDRAGALAADVVFTVARTRAELAGELRSGAALVGLQYPLSTPAFVEAAVSHKLRTIALDMIPRTTLAQSMDVLSSQANLAGYWAVVTASARLYKIFPLLMTAAGTISPARVLIMGVGVAGLQAIGTARRLGAVVEATDVRPETKEQVESLGGKFVAVEGVEYKAGTGGYAAEQSDEYKAKQAEVVSAAIARADVVITTALVPGRKAPRLVSDAQLASMRRGSVVVDLAASQGGNVEVPETSDATASEITHHGVLVLRPRDAASHVAFHASQAFSRNIGNLLLHLTADGEWKTDLAEEIAAGCTITNGGEILNARVRDAAADAGKGKAT